MSIDVLIIVYRYAFVKRKMFIGRHFSIDFS
nr:MAG TPA: hypothetical protein [Caudoviricetes sp.]